MNVAAMPVQPQVFGMWLWQGAFLLLLVEAFEVWGAHVINLPWQRAGAAEPQLACEESPCSNSCAQLWHLSQNKTDGHHIPGASPLSPAPGEILECWHFTHTPHLIPRSPAGNRELGCGRKAVTSLRGECPHQNLALYSALSCFSIGHLTAACLFWDTLASFAHTSPVASGGGQEPWG